MYRVRFMCIGIGAAALLCLGALPLGTFTWDAAGGNDNWNNYVNWGTEGEYPDDTGDDAVIPYTSGGYTVDLIDESIGDLTIEGDVDFGTVSKLKTLTVAALTLDAPTGGLTVTANSDATLVANDP